MDKSLKSFLLIFISSIIIFLGILFYFFIKGHKENLAYNFTGAVENVKYDIKGYPTVTIDSKDYYLSTGYNFDFQIEKGDKLKKEKGKTTYILIKQKTGKILVFDN